MLQCALTMKTSYRLDELARASGTPPRTIRFYIARGILAGPPQAGRNAVYGRAHLERLKEIARLKQKGLTLAEIARALSPGVGHRDIPPPATCHSYALSDDVTVLVRTDVSPWRMNSIRRALAEWAAELRKETEHENGKS